MSNRRIAQFASLTSVCLWLPSAQAQSDGGSLISNLHAIEGYSNQLSSFPGESLSFSVHAPSGAYSVSFYRYGMDGPIPLVAGPFACNGARRDYTATSYAEGAAWGTDFTLVVPNGAGNLTLAGCTGSFATSAWRSGLYVARASGGGATFDMTFIVKDPPGSQKSIVVLASTNTWQAYNFWPFDGSFYDQPAVSDGDGGLACPAYPPRPTVAFHRPNPYATPEVHDDLSVPFRCQMPFYRTEHLAAGEVRLLRWLERHGYAYSMLTDTDIHKGWNETTKQTALDPFLTVVISTHSEYWTDNMYKSFTSYLKRGGNVLSISGNTAYHRTGMDVLADGGETITNLKTAGGTFQLWGNFTQSPDPSWVDFVPKNQLLGFDFTGSGAFPCLPLSPTAAAMSSGSKLAHWSFDGVANGVPLGVNGEIAPNSTRCTGGTSGASGEEVDHAAPAFAREFTVLANRASPATDMVHLRRASAGQVFTIGSLTAGASLTLPAETGLSSVVQNVLARFNRRAFSDFNGDGYPDLIGRGSGDGNLKRLEGNGQGGLKSTTPITFDTGWSTFDTIVSPGDLDSDGAPDLLARRTSDGALVFYRGTGAGTLVQVNGVSISNGWGGYVDILTPGDFDGDGRPDVIVRNAGGQLLLYRGNGSGGFTTAAGNLFDSGWGNYVEVMSPGDFGAGGVSGGNEDGVPDIIARKADGTLWLYRGVGNGTLDQNNNGVLFDSGWSGYSKLIGAGDFNGDGHADLFALKPDGTLWLYLGTGHGTLVQTSPTLVGSGFSQLSTLFSVW